MEGIFSSNQPLYEAAGIATFPVREKRPAIKGYLEISVSASRMLATKFKHDNAFGFACRASGITVLDVDTDDERILADAISELGPTPIVARTGGGHYHAWYRNGGEGRNIRPNPKLPIDILGDGYVVAPPSVSARGNYAFICGSLQDLNNLPLMRKVEPPPEILTPVPLLIDEGRRNQELWKYCMQRSRACGTIQDLMRAAVQANAEMFYDPLSEREVLKIVSSAWAKESSGDNWFGRGGRVVLDAVEIDDLMAKPDALLLLTILRRYHWGRDFVVANAMAATMPGGGWPVKRLAAARKHLLDTQFIEELRPASRQRGPAIYKFKSGQI